MMYGTQLGKKHQLHMSLNRRKVTRQQSFHFTAKNHGTFYRNERDADVVRHHPMASQKSETFSVTDHHAPTTRRVIMLQRTRLKLIVTIIADQILLHLVQCLSLESVLLQCM
jgi:hypothetical protein